MVRVLPGGARRGGQLRALIGCGIWENEFRQRRRDLEVYEAQINDITAARWMKLGEDAVHGEPAGQ